MKRFWSIFAGCMMLAVPVLRAQDNTQTNAAAAVASREEAAENYETLKGHVDDMLAAQADQARQIQDLKKEIEDLRQQMSKPEGNYASADDLKQLAQTVQDLDKKREADKELILQEMQKLAQAISAPAPRLTTKPAVSDEKPGSANPDQNGFYYTIKKGDTLSLVAQAYREQEGLKVSVKQIEEANPNINPAKLGVGMKVFIPAPKGFVPKSQGEH